MYIKEEKKRVLRSIRIFRQGMQSAISHDEQTKILYPHRPL